jgi:hypothetical protein
MSKQLKKELRGLSKNEIIALLENSLITIDKLLNGIEESVKRSEAILKETDTEE